MTCVTLNDLRLFFILWSQDFLVGCFSYYFALPIVAIPLEKALNKEVILCGEQSSKSKTLRGRIGISMLFTKNKINVNFPAL